jgi:hypothetical protein
VKTGEREAFEAWYSGVRHPHDLMEKYRRGDYVNTCAHTAWLAWQAALHHAGRPARRQSPCAFEIEWPAEAGKESYVSLSWAPHPTHRSHPLGYLDSADDHAPAADTKDPQDGKDLMGGQGGRKDSGVSSQCPTKEPK